MENYDVAIIGGGPGGYVAAIRSAQLGLKTVVIEKEHLGGVCLNWGCIPTKALLRSSELYHTLGHAADFGLKAEKLSFDLKAIVERSRKVSSQLAGGIGHLMKKNKVHVIEATAKLAGNGKIDTTSKDGKTSQIQAKNIIIATGARARQLPGLESDGKLIWTAKEAMVPDTMPKSLLIVGSGAIGIEFASFYRSLGAEVTVVEIMDRILPAEDAEISALAQKNFEKQGIKILTKTGVKKLDKDKNSVTATLETNGKEENLKIDRVIIAAGIVGNVENLGLEKTKVKIEKSHILNNEFCETDEKGIYAIGDVAAAPWLAHKASHEAIIVVEKIAGKNPHPIKKDNIPGCTYSMPQIASVGLSEEKAKALGREIKVGRFPFMGNGKAIALGEPDGLIKTIFDAKTGELLGAHMIGAEVTELIQGFVIAKTLEATEEDLMHTIFAHPTLSEMMHESVLAAFGRAIHI